MPGAFGFEEDVELSEEHLRRRVGLEQHVVVGLQRDQPGPGDGCGDRRPSSNGFTWSPRACSTRVGTCSCGSSGRTSIPARAWRKATAFSGDVVRRMSSSIQSICSSVAPGMNMSVNTRRKRPSGRPQPDLDEPGQRLVHGLGLVVGLDGRVRAQQDQPADPLRVPVGVRDGDRPTLRHAEQGERLQPAGVDDRLEVVDPRLEAEVGDLPVGQAEPALVVAVDGRQLGRARAGSAATPGSAGRTRAGSPSRC